MKVLRNILLIIVSGLLGCKDDDVASFEKTADERVEETIAALKSDLVAPANGWRLRYEPEQGSGQYYVFMKFEDNGEVRIRTDLGANDGEFFDQTITYRVDSRLGIELILENYCFFSFLFEQNQATFGAEYEFKFVNKTPDNALVFTSKSDIGSPTILLFREALANEADEKLGTALATNLNTLADDLDNFAPSAKLTYTNKDLIFFISLDNFRRTLAFTGAARKSNTNVTQAVNFDTPFIIEGDSIIFNNAFTGTFLGNSISIRSIKFNNLTNGQINVCTDPIAIHGYTGVTSANDPVTLETTLLDIRGAAFATLSDFYICPIGNIIDNGVFVGSQVEEDIKGALAMQIYYNYDLGDGTPFYAIGFIIQNVNGTVTFALREFTPVLTNNNLVLNLAPDISIFGEQNTDADTDNINIYINALAGGGDTYVFEYAENVYEFFNPCTGWSFVFYNANQ
jgi:hypothetical protein